MRCEDARAALWPPERPRLMEGEVADAQAHVEACPACTAFFAQDRAILEVWDRARTIRAPVELRERVIARLAHLRSRDSTGPLHPAPPPIRTGIFVGRPWARVAAAVLVLSGSFAGILLVDRTGVARARHDGPEVYVEEYLRRAVGQNRIETADPREVSLFIEQELGVRVEPLRLAGLHLLRAEICLLQGQRGAMIVYRENGRELHHYVLPRDHVATREPSLSELSGLTSEMPVVTWAHGRVEEALVGEVEPKHLLSVVIRGGMARD